MTATDTDRSSTATVARGGLAVALAVLAIVGTLPTGFAAADPGVRAADLAIQEPSYADGTVETFDPEGEDASGYVAQGERLNIRPQNFDAANVTDFAVETGAGSLSYDTRLGVFVFDPQGETGTFVLRWTVSETVVETGANNTTTTDQALVTYRTRLRVDGLTQMSHLTDEERAEREQLLEVGEEVNATMQNIRGQDLLFAPTSGSDLELFQVMVDRYVSTGDPLRALTGGYTQIWVLALLTPGGLLFLLTVGAPAVWLAYRRSQERNEAETTAEYEGDLADRERRLREAEARQEAANADWTDMMPDSRARAFRDSVGDIPLHGWEELKRLIEPCNVVRDRLQVMAQFGYVARRVEDGAFDYEVVDADAVLKPGEDISDREDLVSLADPSPELLDGLDWGAEAIRAFEADPGEVDFTELDTESATMDVDELAERFDVEMRRFDSRQEFGELLRDLVEWVEHSELTDARGQEDSIHYTIQAWLDTAHTWADQHADPSAAYLREALSLGLARDDEGARTTEYLEEVRDGGA